MKEREVRLTPSEFMGGYLHGVYGINHLTDADPVTQLLREVTFDVVEDRPRNVMIYLPPIKLKIDEAAVSWQTLLSNCEIQIQNGLELVDIYHYLIEHHFETALLDRTPRHEPLRVLFDFITGHLIYFKQTLQYGIDDGRAH